MKPAVTMDQLMEKGLDREASLRFLNQMQNIFSRCATPEQAWSAISRDLISDQYAFDIHLLVYNSLFPDRESRPESAPAWVPAAESIASANLTKFMSDLGMDDINAFHAWTVSQYQNFWSRIVKKLGIVFDKAPDNICDLSQGKEFPVWFPGSRMNIINSCFTAPGSATAIIYEDSHKNLIKLSYDELDRLSNRVANSLIQSGINPGDAIGIAMPMNHYAVAIYLGIIKMGGVVVSIADSFSSEEIAIRLKIAHAKAIFTQDFTHWGEKYFPLYEKVSHCRSLPVEQNDMQSFRIIVTPCESRVTLALHESDKSWESFLVDSDIFTPESCLPMSPCNILFSSGTTGSPKAIIWNHTTPIKAASDAFFHQNIQAGDVMAWPTNLGWMMGPWLIFAALINHAAIALYSGAPKDRAFGEFIQHARVNMLGVVPTLVATWRQSGCMENLDWHTIKVFSSTGECSNAEDMFYLMFLAGYKPVIEYCGGTEIGGAYISSTVIQMNYPSLFTTPAMGMNFAIIDENGQPASTGEVAIIPPSIGLSTQLLNADHYQVYFEHMPKSANGEMLRRHGDQIKQLPGGFYSILGRVDDTMKLGGIKTSAAEIERTLAGLPDILEVAAIAIPPANNGPNLLIIYASTAAALNKQDVMKEMQKKINLHLNPLFKIHDIVLTTELPKTASNKIMRRILRKKYLETM
ncbi:Acetyl-coenzyme A synthetase [Aquicella siphonis]|uniref:Acetyl-coenzyme A synthetase n=1 Tax=Aquicella siphonis TaxID=254247 RepID=A0A5E4PKB6_9COXI|nr:AMP-binding protein [Aquicella siphonis]VVC76968.1 Acetyl-coenzyme A synthetase [Aquicella siphonis]